MVKTKQLGTISHGTLRTEDLLNACAFFLQDFQLEAYKELALPENRELAARIEQVKWDAFEADAYSEDADYLLNEDVFPLMDELAPMGHYFGAHPGDGSDLGFWPIDDNDEE
jgi:hypothetical protein